MEQTHLSPDTGYSQQGGGLAFNVTEVFLFDWFLVNEETNRKVKLNKMQKII